jgi:hypothetical protein
MGRYSPRMFTGGSLNNHLILTLDNHTNLLYVSDIKYNLKEHKMKNFLIITAATLLFTTNAVADPVSVGCGHPICAKPVEQKADPVSVGCGHPICAS